MTREEILRGIGEVARAHLDLQLDLDRDLNRDLEAEALGGEGGPALELHPELRLAEDLALDSIQRLTLAVEVENRFRVCLDPEDEEGIETVGDLADVVGTKLREGSPHDR